MLAVGSISMLPVIISLGAFTAKNWGMPRFAIPAIVLDIAAIATLAALNVQIGMALNIDYTQPIAAIQKRLEMLRKFRIRYIQAILVSAALLWMPMFIVVMKTFLGADVYRLFPTAWIVTNVAFGFAVLALGIWLLKKYRPGAGYNIDAASGFMARLAEFEDPYSAPGAFEHAGVFAGRIELEIEIARVDWREVALALLGLEDLVGVAEIGAHELIGQYFPRRRGGEQGVQAERAAEDRLVVGHAPFAQFRLHGWRRVLNQQRGEALVEMPRRKHVLVALGEFQALLDPARQIFAHVVQHSQFRVASVEQGPVQVLARGFALRQ